MSNVLHFQHFDPKVETITEFLERFSVQNNDQIVKAGEDEIKKAAILIKNLPVNVITELQRKLQPKTLSTATYDVITASLTNQYKVKKSLVGASVRFLNKKQAPGESIESYSRILNTYASDCKYKDCCLDRLLRDAFIAGIRDTTILTDLLQECDKDSEISFINTVEKAKIMEQLRLDAQSIKSHDVSNSTFKVNKPPIKLDQKYKCIRCTARGKHLASDCWAIKLKCNLCSNIGHIGKACLNKKIKSIQEQNYGEEAGENQNSNGEGSVIGQLRGTWHQSRTNQRPPHKHPTALRQTAAANENTRQVHTSLPPTHDVPHTKYKCTDPTCNCDDFLA